jgi:spore coat protein U-like protein
MNKSVHAANRDSDHSIRRYVSIHFDYPMGQLRPRPLFCRKGHQMNRKLILAAVVASAFTATNAFAATAFDDFTVKIVLTNSCTIVADDLDFGSQTGLTADIDVDTAVHVTCTGANPVSVSFNAGTGTGSTIAARAMNSGANVVGYNIYTTAARATPLGQTAGTDTIDFTSTGGGTADDKTVYGRVPAQAAKPNGTYLSTVRATVTY